MTNTAPAIDTTAAEILEQLLRARYSCRAFVPAPVDDRVIERILALAQLTPSWCNAQPWKVIVTRGAATESFRDALFEHTRTPRPEPDIPFPQEYRGAYRDRRRECGFRLYDAVGAARGDSHDGRRARHLRRGGLRRLRDHLHAGGEGARRRVHRPGGAGIARPLRAHAFR